MKKLLLFSVLVTMFSDKWSNSAIKRYCLLFAVLSFSMISKADLYIWGDATCVNWSYGADNRSPVAMVQTDANTFIWVGYLTSGSARFKFSNGPDEAQSYNGYFAQSADYKLESGNNAKISGDATDDKKFYVSEEGMWKIVIKTNTEEITATKLSAPSLDEDSFYQITSLNDYYWYAGMMTSNKDDNNDDGLTSKKARLTADLTFSSTNPFFPIGCYTNKYNGEFDGGSHTIDGIQVSEYVNIKNYALGFIRFATAGANIHDLCIGPNSSFSGWRKVGGIIGRIRDIGGEIRLTNVVNAAVITATDTKGSDGWEGNAGGLFACATDVYVTVTNCANLGNVSGQDGQCAAFAGWTSSYNSYKTTFTNCWNSGTISNMQDNNNLYRSESGDAEDSNCYDVTGVDTHTQGIKLGTGTKGSGELCYKLNSGTTAWKQTIGTDNYPKLFGSTGVVKEVVEDESYTNLTIFDDDSNDKVQISSKADLIQFSKEVNAGNKALNAVLTANIDMSEPNSHTPIGTSTNRYCGTFDGKDHRVTLTINRPDDEYQGLFGYATRGATFQNLIIDGTIVCGESSAALVGKVGESGESGTITIKRVGCEANVTGNGTNTKVGAFVGDNWDGTIKLQVENSYNIGDISCSNYSTVMGFWTDGSSTFKNVYNIGSLSVTADSAPVYQFIVCKDGTGSGTLTNCYTQKSKSSAEVTGGELCAKLGYAFHQSAEDTYPNLNTTHDFVTKMSSVGYTTQYISESAVTRPSGVTAYAGEINDTWLRLVPIDGTIPKGEPVILKGTANTIYRFAPTTDVDRVTNDLKGSDGDITGNGSTIFALANLGTPTPVVGFYLVNDGVTVPAGKAYLNTGAGVKGFTFLFDDDATSIEMVNGQSSMVNDNEIYNLAGQRIQKMQKGINIVNGKKIMK